MDKFMTATSSTSSGAEKVATLGKTKLAFVIFFIMVASLLATVMHVSPDLASPALSHVATTVFPKLATFCTLASMILWSWIAQFNVIDKAIAALVVLCLVAWFVKKTSKGVKKSRELPRTVQDAWLLPSNDLKKPTVTMPVEADDLASCSIKIFPGVLPIPASAPFSPSMDFLSPLSAFPTAPSTPKLCFTDEVIALVNSSPEEEAASTVPLMTADHLTGVADYNPMFNGRCASPFDGDYFHHSLSNVKVTASQPGYRKIGAVFSDSEDEDDVIMVHDHVELTPGLWIGAKAALASTPLPRTSSLSSDAPSSSEMDVDTNTPSHTLSPCSSTVSFDLAIMAPTSAADQDSTTVPADEPTILMITTAAAEASAALLPASNQEASAAEPHALPSVSSSSSSAPVSQPVVVSTPAIARARRSRGFQSQRIRPPGSHMGPTKCSLAKILPDEAEEAAAAAKAAEEKARDAWEKAQAKAVAAAKAMAAAKF